MDILKIILLLLMTISSRELFSQDKSVFDLFKRNEKKAEMLFEDTEYSRAKYYYKKLHKNDPENALYKLRLAECYMFLNNTHESEKWFKLVINDSLIKPIHELFYAEVLVSNGKSDSARIWFKKFNQHKPDDTRSKNMFKENTSDVDLRKDSLAYSVNSVNFNSSHADFSAIYYGKGIVFISSRNTPAFIRNINSTHNTSFLDLYYTEPVNDSSFSEPLRFHEDLSSSLHEGPITFFDKDRKVIFSKNVKAGGKDDVKRLFLFYGELSKKGNKWIHIKQLPFCSKDYNISHPYFNSPTNTLYFVSDMPGGYGGFDIFTSVHSDGEWSQPLNLGPGINTEKNESFPFIGRDSVLFFSSDGHGGLGGLDIFRSDLRNKAAVVTNVGHPVNSSQDDFAFVLNEKLSEGFFSSNRENGGLNDDIYKVYINRLKIEGELIDKLRYTAIRGAKVVLINVDTEEKEEVIVSDQNGFFKINAITGRKYRLEVHAKGYRTEVVQVYSKDPSQKIVKVKRAMEKYNKTFVKGKVMFNGESAGITRIQIFDPTADTVEVVYSNAKGEFESQINTDTTNILLADNHGMLGVYLTTPSKRKRKSSSVQFIEVALGTLDSVEVKGVFLEDSIYALPDQKAMLILKNELTNREMILSYNDMGEFAIKLWDACNYKVYVERNQERKLIYSFEPIKSRYIELIE